MLAVEDATGHGHAARSGMPLHTVAGRRGPALVLPGRPEQALTVVSTPALNDQAMTLALWLNYASVSPHGFSATWFCQDGPKTRVFQLCTSDGRLCWHRMGAQEDARSRGAVLPGRWYHVAAVVFGHEHRLYLDGELQGTTTGPLGARLETPLVLGHGRAGSAAGLVEDVLLWTRALSDAEVLALYRA